jgi:uncharacterized protein
MRFVAPACSARALRAAALAALCIVAFAACSPAKPSDRLDVVGADGAHHIFHIELAARPAERERGLMYRQSLAADAGMLFDFGEDRPVSMWMKNTFIPLDMLFITRDGTIIAIAADTVPQSLDIISSGRPVRAVLEIKGGEAARQGIVPGARAIHPLFDGSR